MCPECLESLLTLEIWDNRYALARFILRGDNHFHFFSAQELNNTDGEETPPMGTPIP